MYLSQEIEIGEQVIEVTLEGELETINPSFGHEFGLEEIEPFQQLEAFPTWNHDLYSFEQNWIIAIHIFYNFLSIEKQFCDLELSFANDY